MFINTFASDNQLSLSSARPIQYLLTPSRLLENQFQNYAIYAHVCQVVSLLRVSLPNHYATLSAIRATYSVHLLFLDVIIQILCGKKDRSKNILLCSLFHPYIKAKRLLWHYINWQSYHYFTVYIVAVYGDC